MLYELAMTPAVFDAERAVNDPDRAIELRELLRSLLHCGMVANLNKEQWQKYVTQRLGDDRWPVTRRSEITALLSQLSDRKRLVRHPKHSSEPPTTEQAWYDLALISHRSTPLDWIVVTEELRPLIQGSSPAATTDLRSLLPSAQWNPHRSLSVLMCRSGYQAALSPLLRHAKWVELVDPFTSTRDDCHFSIVRLCTDLLRERDQTPPVKEIVIHTGQRADEHRPTEEVLDEWESKLQTLNSRRRIHRRFKVMLWKRKTGGPRFHDRYLLTDQCGVSVPGGFDCFSEGTSDETTWTLLDHATWTKQLNLMRPETSHFELLGERIIT